ncbi:hypothetical protein EDM22_17120 [Agromyces tardus]|uniref:Uncharacterized protein n=1 Tax=Agromyces tardus TaxID=2583849 RepID=A0A3M8A1Q5_9MICO|nr:hypothetical protein [Agromyces tardus]RNB45094.1 hypothetical protein EDM22_17120 [Agromyces tardus]
MTSSNAPLVAHLVVLATGFVVFSLIAARGWFFYDDWYFLTSQSDVIWSPHVGHWNTVPALLFLGIQRVFGMDHYLPFAMPAILAHLAAVHLIWRITLRATVRPWLATAFSVLLTFLGAGAEALAWAVQIGFVGAITGMLGVVVLLESRRITLLRGVLTSALVLLSLASSGVAVPFIPVAIAIAWLRHGVLRTIAVFTAPIIAFVVWYLLRGQAAPMPDRASGFAETFAVPEYAVAMLSDGLGKVFPLAVIGGIVFIALGVWWIFTIRSVEPAAIPAYLLFLVAPVFALLTGYTRIGAGLDTATSSRYVYVVVISVAPFMALCFDRASRRSPVAPAAALVLIVAAWNIGGMAVAMTERIQRVDGTRAELAATAATLRADPDCLAGDERPSPQWAPDVTVGDVRRWIDHGWYHPAPVAGRECGSP